MVSKIVADTYQTYRFQNWNLVGILAGLVAIIGIVSCTCIYVLVRDIPDSVSPSIIISSSYLIRLLSVTTITSAGISIYLTVPLENACFKRILNYSIRMGIPSAPVRVVFGIIFNY